MAVVQIQNYVSQRHATQVKKALATQGKHRADKLPPNAILEVARILKTYGDTNPDWESETIADHLNESLTGIFQYLSGESTQDLLANAATRLLFALELLKIDQMETTATEFEPT